MDLRENGSERSHVLLPLIAQVKGDDAWEDDAQGIDDAEEAPQSVGAEAPGADSSAANADGES